MVLEEIASAGLNIGIVIFVIIIGVAVIVTSYFFYAKWKRYQEYDVIVFEKDGFGQLVMKYDKAGIFVDRRTQNKRFFMQKANVGLTPDNIPYITTSGGKKIVYLKREGLKNFFFIRLDIKDGMVQLNVGEEDVNWAINAYERQKKVFGQDKLLAYLPFIILAFVCVVILIIFIYFFKDFGILKDVAIAFKEAAAIYAQAHSGTVILPS